MRRIVRVFAVLAAVALLLCAQYFGNRSVEGTVTDSSGKPVSGAIVELRNPATLGVRSYITKRDGHYVFHGLNTNLDYFLKARYHGKESDQKTLSRFDSSKVATVNLQVPA